MSDSFQKKLATFLSVIAVVGCLLASFVVTFAGSGSFSFGPGPLVGHVVVSLRILLIVVVALTIGFNKVKNTVTRRILWFPLIVVYLLIAGILTNAGNLHEQDYRSQLVKDYVKECASGSSRPNPPCPDQFPFNEPTQQDAWYIEHNVPVSERCYTNEKPACSELDQEKAISVVFTPQQEYVIKQTLCQYIAASWGQTVEECVKD
jgi:hypothetical protein